MDFHGVFSTVCVCLCQKQFSNICLDSWSGKAGAGCSLCIQNKSCSFGVLKWNRVERLSADVKPKDLEWPWMTYEFFSISFLYLFVRLSGWFLCWYSACHVCRFPHCRKPLHRCGDTERVRTIENIFTCCITLHVRMHLQYDSSTFCSKVTWISSAAWCLWDWNFSGYGISECLSLFSLEVSCLKSCSLQQKVHPIRRPYKTIGSFWQF